MWDRQWDHLVCEPLTWLKGRRLTCSLTWKRTWLWTVTQTWRTRLNPDCNLSIQFKAFDWCSQPQQHVVLSRAGFRRPLFDILMGRVIVEDFAKINKTNFTSVLDLLGCATRMPLLACLSSSSYVPWELNIYIQYSKVLELCTWLCCHRITSTESGSNGELAHLTYKQCPIRKDHALAGWPAHLRIWWGPKKNVTNFLSFDKQLLICCYWLCCCEMLR